MKQGGILETRLQDGSILSKAEQIKSDDKGKN
jgi:hypothetical protein